MFSIDVPLCTLYLDACVSILLQFRLPHVLDIIVLLTICSTFFMQWNVHVLLA